MDGGTFWEEFEHLHLQSVPTVMKDGELFLQGRATLEQIVSKIGRGMTGLRAKRLNALEPFDVLVIGVALPPPPQQYMRRVNNYESGWWQTASGDKS